MQIKVVPGLICQTNASYKNVFIVQYILGNEIVLCQEPLTVENIPRKHRQDSLNSKISKIKSE